MVLALMQRGCDSGSRHRAAPVKGTTLSQSQALLARPHNESAAGPMWKNCGKPLVTWGLALGSVVLIDPGRRRSHRDQLRFWRAARVDLSTSAATGSSSSPSGQRTQWQNRGASQLLA